MVSQYGIIKVRFGRWGSRPLLGNGPDSDK